MLFILSLIVNDNFITICCRFWSWSISLNSHCIFYVKFHIFWFALLLEITGIYCNSISLSWKLIEIYINKLSICITVSCRYETDQDHLFFTVEGITLLPYPEILDVCNFVYNFNFFKNLKMILINSSCEPQTIWLNNFQLGQDVFCVTVWFSYSLSLTIGRITFVHTFHFVFERPINCWMIIKEQLFFSPHKFLLKTSTATKTLEIFI